MAFGCSAGPLHPLPPHAPPERFRLQLPFALDLIKSSLEAGHSLNRSLQLVVQEFGDPLGSEFRTVLEQTRIGLPLPRALEDMLKRVPEEDLRLLVVAVNVQTEVGSSLAAIVGRLSEIVRMRQRLKLQNQSLDRAIADGRDDRRCAADRSPVRLQPGPAGIRGDPVQRSDRSENTQNGDSPRCAGVLHDTALAQAAVLAAAGKTAMSSSLLISLFVFSLIGVGGVAIYVALYGSHRVVEERFNDLAVRIRASQGTLDDDAPQDESVSRLLFKWAEARIPAPDPNTPSGEKLSETLQQAGYIGGGKAHTFQVFRVLTAIGLGILMAAFASIAGKRFGMVALMAIIGILLGTLVPTFYIKRRARIRQMAIATQLSDVLDLLVVCVEAGLGLFEAIKIVGVETQRQKQEIGRELSLVASEISAGASLGQALRNLADRTAVEDIKPLAATLIQSEQLGAQIAPALHASSDALRMRRRLRAEEAAQKTTIKILFPLVLFVLPAMLAVIFGPAIIQIIHTIAH